MLQDEYSVLEREAEEKVLPVLREFGIGLVTHSPLGRGFPTGQVKPAGEYPADDMRSRDERRQGENYTYELHATEQLEDLAATRGIRWPHRPGLPQCLPGGALRLDLVRPRRRQAARPRDASAH